MSTRSYYELRTYRFDGVGQRQRFGAFLEKALIPAYERLGITPVGAFVGIYGVQSADLILLLPHPDLDSVAEATDRLFEDPQFLEAGRAFLETDIDHPSYYRYESSVLRAFDGMPQLDLPKENLSRSTRIFEIRTYCSHSVPAARRKIEMFNDGGEIDIFRKTGLAPVLFGETITGPRMPNLTYVLTFDGMRERDEAWETFKADPEWERLRADPAYADTVTSISDVIVAPAPYSLV